MSSNDLPTPGIHETTDGYVYVLSDAERYKALWLQARLECALEHAEHLRTLADVAAAAAEDAKAELQSFLQDDFASVLHLSGLDVRLPSEFSITEETKQLTLIPKVGA